MHPFLLMQLFLFHLYLLIYLFNFIFAMGSDPVVFEGKSCCICFTQNGCVRFEASRTDCLVIVVLVAVVIHGPVAPVHFNASYCDSARAEE